MGGSQQRQLDTARADAREARRRLAFFERTRRAAMSGFDELGVLNELARIAVPELGDYTFIDLWRDGGKLERVGFHAVDPRSPGRPDGRSALRSGLMWSADTHPAIDVMRKGVPEVFSSISTADRARMFEAEGAAVVVHDGTLHAMMVAPIHIRGEVAGALTICYGPTGRQPDGDDLLIADELANGAAFALDNARLRREADARTAELAGEKARHETALREFLATVSHELRSPLAALLLWEKILRTAKDDTMRARAVEAIHQSALAQSKMIEDLLDLSRCVSGTLDVEVSRLALDEVIDGALEAAIPAAAARRIVLETRREDALGTILGDPMRLRQVLGNLLSNAFKFTEAGGKVTVTARQRNTHAEIVVSDTGRGISRARLPNIFKPFQSRGEGTVRVHTGLGLGLAMVAQLVELHHGTVAAASEGEGRGATLTVTLPLARDGDEAPATSDATPRSADPDRARRSAGRSGRLLKGLRVLVVDDEARVREAITLVLRDAGSKVTAAASAAEAYAALRASRWDAVVSDIGMPEEDGYSLIRRVRELPRDGGSGVGAVALTGYARPQDQSRAIEAGFDMHLTKPVEAGDLIRAVASVARRAAPPAPPLQA